MYVFFMYPTIRTNATAKTRFYVSAPFRSVTLKMPFKQLWFFVALLWRHNECDGVSNHKPYDCLFNRLLKAQI